MSKNKTIEFTGRQLEEFLDNDGTHEDFPNWTFESNTSEGEYDGEHGAMCDFPMYMYNSETDETYTTTGGYYNEGAGECYGAKAGQIGPYVFNLIRNVCPINGKPGKKYFEAAINIKVFVEDVEEITHEDARKIINKLGNDKFKIELIEF